MGTSTVKYVTEAKVEEYIKRRMYLLDHTPPCPVCGQKCRIRLEEYVFVCPATWRCLDCNRGFAKE